MKKITLNVLIIFIFITIVTAITSISYATEVSDIEKQKIEKFINDEENVLFSYYNYSKVEEIPLDNDYSIPWVIAMKYGTLLEEYEDEEITEIVKEFKAYVFKKSDANKFFQSKAKINFDELNAYDEFEKSHTTSTNKENFYYITEGFGIENLKYEIKSIKKLENENIEVEIAYRYEDVEKDDNNGTIYTYERVLTKIVTLTPNEDSYSFVSSIKKSDDSDDETAKIEKFINDEENVLFSYYNYSKVEEIPLGDDYSIPWVIAMKYGTLLEEYEDEEITEIVKEFKAYVFKKADANKFFQSKAKINFDKLNAYNEFEKSHTTSTNKENFYYITEGFGIENLKYEIKSIKKLENGNIEVEIAYRYEDAERDDNNGTIYTYERVLTKIVTLTPNEDSYSFVSSIKKSDEKIKLLNEYSYESEKNDNNKSDTTTAKGNIPQTGSADTAIIFGIVMLIIILVIIFIKKKNWEKICK